MLGRPLQALALGAVLIAAGCAVPPPPQQSFHPDRSDWVFAKGFTNIQDKYIRKLDISNFVFDGINNLGDIDPHLKALRTRTGIRMTRADKTIGDFQMPADEHPGEWAELVTRIVVATKKQSAELRSADSEAIFKAVFNGILEPLDHHSRYAEPSSARDYRAQREGFGGIGVNLDFAAGLPKIVTILPESPAAESRLRVGDVITHVDASSLTGLDRNTIIWRLRGNEGSAVKLRVARPGREKTLDITIRRSLIFPETVHFSRHGKVGVIRVSGFNQRTAQSLERVIVGLPWNGTPPIEGIVLDLRSNPGGLLEQAVAVADAFLRKGRIVSTRGRHPESYQVFNATGRDLTHGTPMIVLINGRSASAAEIVAAALQDHGRAVLIGSNSYGKGTVQNITRLPNDGELILTWSRFHAPSGYSLQDLGVFPNICSSKMDSAGSGIPAAPVIKALTQSRAVLSTWRTLSDFHDQRRAALRIKCPQAMNKPKLDLDIARRILSDRRLYARSLDISAPNVAKQKRAEPPTE